MPLPHLRDGRRPLGRGGNSALHPEFRRRRYDGIAAYAQSKQADRMLTWAFARHDGGRVASGVYFARLRFAGGNRTLQVTVAR